MLGIFLTGWLRRIEWLLILWIGLTWLRWFFPDLSFRIGLVLVQRHIAFFALGILAFLVFAGRRSLLGVLPMASFAIFTMVVVEGPEKGLVALLVATLLFALATGWLGWLNQPFLIWLGGISYSLYLLHETIGWSLIRWLEAAGVEANGQLSWRPQYPSPWPRWSPWWWSARRCAGFAAATAQARRSVHQRRSQAEGEQTVSPGVEVHPVADRMLGAQPAIRTGQHATRRNKAAARSRGAGGADLRMGGAKAFGDAGETRHTLRIDG